jgi:transcriptional regulator with XRE-family HTH domain
MKWMFLVIKDDKRCWFVKYSTGMTTLEKFNSMGDTAVLEMFGRRLNRRRIELHITQADLADRAGVSKRTVERMENGAAVQTLSLVRVLRVLDLLRVLDQLVPETGPRPMDLLKLKGKDRKRASTGGSGARSPKKWSWGKDA